MSEERRGDWMQTYTGRKVWPLDPRPEDIDLTDIAWALSHQCRYNGHGRFFYSVAEHSWLMAQHFLAEGQANDAVGALLHDASEAYLGDCVRPLKRSLPEFKAIERVVEEAIYARFRIEDPSPAVHAADRLILTDERNALFDAAVCERNGWNARAGIGMQLRCWQPHEAFLAFQKCAEALGIQ